MSAVEYVTVTIPCYEPEYRFEIALSHEAIRRLAHYRVLGIELRKNKYQFLNDLSEILAQGILEKLEEIVDR